RRFGDWKTPYSGERESASSLRNRHSTPGSQSTSPLVSATASRTLPVFRFPLHTAKVGERNQGRLAIRNERSCFWHALGSIGVFSADDETRPILVLPMSIPPRARLAASVHQSVPHSTT